MSQADDRPGLSLDRLDGGMNTHDASHLIPLPQCMLAFNVDWYLASFARKRGGSTTVSVAGGTAWGGHISWLSRYVPGADEGAAQFWGADDAAVPLVKFNTGAAWANATMVDNIAAAGGVLMNAVTFNGKHFVAYDSAVDRLHVVRNDGTLNRMGLAQPAVPTLGALAGGAVTDTRTYKIAWVVRVAGVVTRRSELSVPTGTIAPVAQQVPVTKSAAPGEGETDWELYGASTDGIYWKIATTVIGTATVNDNNASLSAVTGVLAPQVGINSLFPSVKYLATDGNRIFGAGSWEGRQNSRVWFTPVIGDNDIGDDERMVDSTSRKTYVDLNENDGGYITGLAQPLQGALYVFKFRQVWKLTPTGDFQTPYQPYRVSSTFGCISHRSIQTGVDESGNPCIYFASHMGPCRVGDNGVEYLGTDLEQLWNEGPTSPLNQLSSSQSVIFGVYYAEKSQYWLWTPVLFVFDRRLGQRVTSQETRGGWSMFVGQNGVGDAACACLFAETLGVGTMSFNMKPYFGLVSAAGQINRGDTADNTDNGTAFQGSIQTKTFALGGNGQLFSAAEPQIVGAGLGPGTVTLTVSVSPDSNGLLAKNGSVALAVSTTPLYKVAEGCRLAGCQSANWTIGDLSAQAFRWKIDRMFIPFDIDQQVP